MIAAWIDFVRRFAGLVAAAVLAFTVAVAWFAATHLAIDTDNEDMLSKDLPFRQQTIRIRQEFPQYSGSLVAVVEGDTWDLADDGARALAAALRQRGALFRSVSDLEDHPFFRRNGFLYLDVDELGALSARLAQAQPFLGALWRDPSLRGLFGVLGRALGQTDFDVAPVLDAMADAIERGRPLSWRDLMQGGAKPPFRRFVQIQPELDYSSLQPAKRAIEAVRAAAAELGPGARVRLTGSVAMEEEELESVQDGLGLAGILSTVLVAALLLIGLRSVRLAVATLATLVVGLIWTAGFAVAAVGSLNLISVAFAVLFIGLSVDFGIHFGLRYAESAADHATALREAGTGVGGALTLCAVAAAIGFFSFLPTDYVGLAELGLIAGAGMFVALVTNLTVLPALMTLMPPRRSGRAAWGMSFPIPVRPVLWGALIVTLGAVALLPRARFDFDPMNLRDARTESVATALDLIDDPRTSPYSATVLAPSLAAADALASRLKALPEVSGTETLSSYVPGDQDEKLDIIATTALFLAPALSAETIPAPGVDAARAAVHAFAAKLDGTHPRLAAAVRATDPDTLSRLLLSGLRGRLERLRDSLAAEPVTLESLPDDIRDRQVAPDGTARLKIHPREDLRERAALVRFVEAVRTVAPDAAGTPVVILEAGRAVVRAFAEAAGIAVAGIAVLLVVLLRRFRDVALVFAPLVLALLLTVAVSVLAGLPFNFANVIVLPLLFGLGVANGIHMVGREREAGAGRRSLETSTPRAVVFSALTTIGSFGSIALSAHPGTSSMGVLLTVAITMTLICTLVLLPALMAAWPSRQNRPERES